MTHAHTIESLETRTLLAATLANNLLTVTGTDAGEQILVEQKNAQIIVHVGNAQNAFSANQVHRISVDALGGDDRVWINVKRNSLVHGGAGNDTLIGGDGHDTFDGDQGTDDIWGAKGNDTNIWDPGDGSDRFEGGKGFDTLLFNGANGDETFDASANAGRLKFFRNPGNINIDAGTTEKLLVIAKGGKDVVTINNLTGTGVVEVQVDGGDGNDDIRGGNLAEILAGGAGNDTIDGNGGNDAMLGNDGDDLLIWDPGDGNDLNVGGAGADTLRFNGSNGDEVMSMSSTHKYARTIFTRNLGNIVLDVREIETVDVEAKGGADSIIVNDQSAGAVRTVNVDLESATGSNTADDKADNVFVNGTGLADNITVTGAAGQPVTVAGLAATVKVTNASAALDAMAVGGGNGDDKVDASGLAAGLLKKLTLSGDDGGDTLLGSAGLDVFSGGRGDDLADGNQGNDQAWMGRGNDTFVWDPGDGSDLVEGQQGTDTLRFNGGGGAEIMSAVPNGNRFKFNRNLGNIVMDMGTTERLEVFALGGDDNVLIADMTGTGLSEAFLDGGDGNDTLDEQDAAGVTINDVNFENVLD